MDSPFHAPELERLLLWRKSVWASSTQMCSVRVNSRQLCCAQLKLLPWRV